MRKGQMKIQEMAFVLVAIVVFFAMVALVYLSVRFSSIKEGASLQGEESARELARKAADMPEFAWSGCSGCVDIDKVLVFKERSAYKKLWDIDYLMVERVYPATAQKECTRANYPDCNIITLINNTKNYGTPATAFVGLCGYEPSKGGYIKCEIGKIHISAKAVK
jgi:hypothetical protein